MKKVTVPRSINYLYGLKDSPTVIGETWLEPEELCYPNGSMTRKAYCKCEDGKMRVVTCGIPDTYFSIPGFYRTHKARVKGFVSSDESGFKFTAYQQKEGI